MRSYLDIGTFLLVAVSSYGIPIATNPCPRPTGTIVSVNGASVDQWFCGSTAGAWIDPLGSTDNPAQPTFSTNLIRIGDNVLVTSAPFSFSTVPVVTGLVSELYFAMTYDAQETGNNESLQIVEFYLRVGSTTIWSATDFIELNANSPFSLTPLGNGGDLVVYIPVWAFNGLGLTGASQLTLTSRQINTHNGRDEWILSDFGIKTPIQYFTPGQPIWSPTPGNPGGGNPPSSVPEPGTAALLASVAVCAAITSSHAPSASARAGFLRPRGR
jgi:hypothetical protein